MKESRVVIYQLSNLVLDRTIFLRVTTVQRHACRQEINQALDKHYFIFKGLAITLEL